MKTLLVSLFISMLPVALAQAPAAPTPQGFDKVAMASYFRHLMLWPKEVTVAVSDPAPGPMPGFNEITVTGSAGGRSQAATFYISADGSRVVHGDFFEVKKNPFQAIVSNLKTDDLPAVGPISAPVTVVVFADFQCPFCREESGVLRDKMLAAYPKDVKLVFADLPLVSIHPWANAAATAGRCIYHQSNNNFWTFHDWVYAHQSEVTADNAAAKFQEYAKTLTGMDTKQYLACTASPATAQEIDKTNKLGDKLMVDSTPTMFINGRRMVGTVPLDQLKAAIDSELAFQKSTPAADDDCCKVKLALPGAGPK